MNILQRLPNLSPTGTLGQPIQRGTEQLHPAVVITGASEGIGRAFAELLVAKGLSVVVIARDGATLEALAEELRGRSLETGVHVCQADVSELGMPARLASYLDERNLYADVLINNAGVGLGGRFDTQSHADIESILSTNISALVRLTRELLPGMRERGTGGILNVASLAGFMPGPWQALYFASKAFVLSFSQAIAAECADSGVRVMAAAPGPVETRIHSAMKARWTWYRLIFPSYHPGEVAEVLWQGFVFGERLLIPGLVNSLSAIGSRLLPPDILTSFVGWLVRPRNRSGRATD